MAVADISQDAQLELSCRQVPDGQAVITMRGELDIATAGEAYSYIRDVLDRRRGPITLDVTGLTFCDASGLGVLARLAAQARRAGRRLSLTGARPPLVRIMRITGMDSAFPGLRAPALSMVVLALC
ncbi:MAG: STAS domain-containing protein [Streptosporangiaceae bacterium]|nr:STAS domain-containing protein [Streptosporangiaceae bacterium]